MQALIRELKTHLSEYLRQVAAGQEAEAIALLQSLPWIRPGDGKKVRGSDRPLPPGGEGTSTEEVMRWLRG